MEKKTLTIERHGGRANNVAVSEIHDEEKGKSGVSSFCWIKQQSQRDSTGITWDSYRLVVGPSYVEVISLKKKPL